MSVAQGYGKIITSGSIFAYDTGDFRNSYIGEPTTNYQNGISPWTVGGVNTDVTNTIDQGPITNAKTWKFEKTGTSNQWNGWEDTYGGIWTGNSGDIWTTSYWYKTTAPAGSTAFGIGYFYLSNWSAPYNTSILANSNGIIADGQWHYNYTTTQFNENYSNAIIVDGPSWGYSTQAGTLYINGLQWEKKSHPTPFAGYTRSVTQGLLPIVSNQSLNLSAVSFDTNAQMIFDGTNDKIDTGLGNIGNNASFAAIINSAGSANEYNMYMGQLLPYMGAYAGNQIIFSDNIGGTQRTINTNSGTIVTGQNHYVVCTRGYDGTSTTNKVYIDGKLIGSGSWSGAPYYEGYNITVGDGRSTSTWYPFYGKVNATQIYNRTLTSGEIEQNYRHYKTRFNLS